MDSIYKYEFTPEVTKEVFEITSRLRKASNSRAEYRVAASPNGFGGAILWWFRGNRKQFYYICEITEDFTLRMSIQDLATGDIDRTECDYSDYIVYRMVFQGKIPLKPGEADTERELRRKSTLYNYGRANPPHVLSMDVYNGDVAVKFQQSNWIVD